LSDDPATGGPERRTHGKFARTGSGARQQQAGHIGAGDQQHEANRAEQDRITFNAGYLYGRQKDPNTGVRSTTTDNWFLFGKYDYFFSKKFYGFLSSRVERDRIAELKTARDNGVNREERC